MSAFSSFMHIVLLVVAAMLLFYGWVASGDKYDGIDGVFKFLAVKLGCTLAGVLLIAYLMAQYNVRIVW